MGVPEGKLVVMCSLCYHRVYVDSSFRNDDNYKCPRCQRAYVRCFSTFTTPERVKSARAELEASLKKMDRSEASRKGADTRRMNATMHKLYGIRLRDGFRMMMDDELI
jgi:hypothetical protein